MDNVLIVCQPVSFSVTEEEEEVEKVEEWHVLGVRIAIIETTIRSTGATEFRREHSAFSFKHLVVSPLPPLDLSRDQFQGEFLRAFQTPVIQLFKSLTVEMARWPSLSP